MEITNVEVRRVDYGKLKAFAKVVFNHELAVKGFKVIDGSKGLFVATPSEKGSDDKYYPTVYINSDDLYNDLQTAVIGAYNEGASEGASEGVVDENTEEDVDEPVDNKVDGNDDGNDDGEVPF